MSTLDAALDDRPEGSDGIDQMGHFVTGVTVCADGGVWMAP